MCDEDSNQIDFVNNLLDNRSVGEVCLISSSSYASSRHLSSDAGCASAPDLILKRQKLLRS